MAITSYIYSKLFPVGAPMPGAAYNPFLASLADCPPEYLKTYGHMRLREILSAVPLSGL